MVNEKDLSWKGPMKTLELLQMPCGTASYNYNNRQQRWRADGSGSDQAEATQRQPCSI